MKVYATVDQCSVNLPYIENMSGLDSVLTYIKKLHFEEILGEGNKGRGLSHYKEAITFYQNQVKLMWSDNKREQGILLYFSGTGFKAWQSLAELQGYEADLTTLMKFMIKNHARWFTRVDDAIDIINSNLTVDSLYQLIDSKEVLILDAMNRKLSADHQKFYGAKKVITGFTVGARPSDCFLRVYDKKIEQSDENDPYYDLAQQCKSWIRIEAEFKHDKARAVLDDLKPFVEKADSKSIQQKLMGYVVDQWKFTDPDKKPIQLWERLTKLANGNGIIPPLTPAITDRLVQLLKWFLDGGPAGVFYRVSELFGKIGRADFLVFMFNYVLHANTENHYKVPKNMGSDLELILKQHPDIKTIKFYLDRAVAEIEEGRKKQSKTKDK